LTGVGTVPLGAVWKALDFCLPGHRVVEKTHHWWIYPPTDAPPYMRIPKGGHGSRRKVRIECGHVKCMARQFGILDCMIEQINGLR